MRKLTLLTVRILTDEEYVKYKDYAPLPFDWEELESKGKTEIVSEFNGGKVVTMVMLEEVEDDKKR